MNKITKEGSSFEITNYPWEDSGVHPKTVITIGRQYGSGGHDIGKLVAEKLGYAFYDKKLIHSTINR